MKYKTQGFLGMFIDENTEMVTITKKEFIALCFNMDHKTGSESSFFYHYKLADDSEVQVAKLVYEKLLKYGS